MAKLLENTYRHVNIALVNEMAIFCHELGVDLWDSIRCAATKPFGFQAFYPGPGVGGHCIPIDPNYLSYKVRAELKHPFRFVELAQEINSRMPGYVVDRAAELLNTDAKPLNGARVLLLGVTYKKDIADQRESPGPPDRPQAAAARRGAELPRPVRGQLAGRRQGHPARRLPDRAGRPDDPAPGAHRLRPGQHRREGAPAVRHPWQDLRRLGLPAVEEGQRLRVVVCTVVHHPADARIFYREIQALLDAGHDVTYIAPLGEPEDFPEPTQPSLTTVTIPRAVGRRRLGALRAAKAAMAAQMARR